MSAIERELHVILGSGPGVVNSTLCATVFPGAQSRLLGRSNGGAGVRAVAILQPPE